MLLHKESLTDVFQTQLKLVERSESTGVPLSLLLEEAGISYNDLIYKDSCKRRYERVHPLLLSDFNEKHSEIPVISFFSGCGGLDLGLEAAGFSHLACFELNELFCKTIRRNRPKWKVFGPPTHAGDVSKTSDVIETLNGIIKAPFPGIFVGGPPCQPFSIAANQRFSKNGENFKRVGFAHETNGNLFFDFIKLILQFKPQVFLIENVPGLRDVDNGKQLQEAIAILQSEGYFVESPLVIDASNYGIAQQRIRLFIIGARTRKHFTPPPPKKSIIGCGNILSDTHNLFSLSNSEIRMHNSASIKRYAQLNYGQRDHLGRVDRLDPSLPSKTVIAGGTSGGGRSHLHPEIPRTLSVRECAQLQTFPDDFVLLGPTARQFTQVGNAVPPVLAAQIGIAIKKSYF